MDALDRLMEETAARIARLAADEALAAAADDALLVDIRSQDARVRDGIVPGSMHIPRTVLEWRVALDSQWRNPHLGGAGQRLILLCDHGYSSVLAAGTLVRLGLHRAGDVIGGFEAWRQAGLPVVPWRPSGSPGALPGSGPPDGPRFTRSRSAPRAGA